MISEHTRRQLDQLPTLPSEMTPASAAMWCATTVMAAGLERGWSLDVVRQMLITILGAVSVGTDEDQVMAELRQALDISRAHHATKS